MPSMDEAVLLGLDDPNKDELPENKKERGRPPLPRILVHEQPFIMKENKGNTSCLTIAPFNGIALFLKQCSLTRSVILWLVVIKN